MTKKETSIELLNDLAKQARVTIIGNKDTENPNAVYWYCVAIYDGKSFFSERPTVGEAIENCYKLVHLYLLDEIEF